MSKFRILHVFLFVLFALLAVSLGAQSVISISTGTYQGRLDASSRTFDGYRGQEYSLRVQAGVPYQIDVMSSDFDAYVVVFHPNGSRFFNDDGGSGLNARLMTTPDTSGTMRIIARSFSRTPSGSYTLMVQQMGGVAPVLTGRRVGLGTHSGFLSSSSGEFDGYRADEYHVNVTANRSYQIDVMSSDFDAYVVVFHPDGSRFFNDDGGAGLNARLVTTPRTSGTMRIIARSFSRTPTGNYTMTVQDTGGGGGTAMASRSVGLGTHVGFLGSMSGEFDGYRAEEFRVNVSANRTYQIDVMSSDFDAYVVVFHPDGSRFVNDDGGDGLNARLVTTPRTSGTMRVIARSFSRTPNGNYTVLINEAGQVNPGVQNISLGTIVGNLTATSPRFDGYRGQEFRLQVSANRTYQIDLMSNDFDAYLVVYHPDGSWFTNDDGGDGLNSRLVTTPRTGGTMRIIARGFWQDATGQYRLQTQLR